MKDIIIKIWNGYGSEHSMNLVLIGKFKQVHDAESVEKHIRRLSNQAVKDDSFSLNFAGLEHQKFSDEMLLLLRTLKINTLAPAELGQFASDYHIDRNGEEITVTTDEADVSAFVKLFVEAGGKVEVFSAHDYPPDSKS